MTGWTESRYREVCVACDWLLREDDTIERVAIPWLHVVREHPVFLRQYASLYEGPRRADRVASIKARIAWNASVGQRLFRRESTLRRYPAIPRDADVIFVSHLVDASHLERDTDFYFADLPASLGDAGMRCVTVLINHTGIEDADVIRRNGAPQQPRVVLSRRESVSVEMSIRKRLARESGRIRAVRLDDGATPLQRSVVRKAAVEAKTPGAASSLRVAVQIAGLIRRLRPRVIVTTFEGHAWERVLFAAARDADPSIHRVGYQHAALFRLQHAIRRPLGTRYDPDTILTAGHNAAEQIRGVTEWKHKHIAVLGSSRGLGTKHCGSPQVRRNSVLVLPEGVMSECRLMFTLATEAATLLPDVEFVLRLHPILRRQAVTRELPALRALPRNVRWSDSSLADDACQARWVLYRGTTAVVDAVHAGAVPVYVEVPHELSVDLLDGSSTARPSVADPAQLVALVTGSSDSAAEGRSIEDRAALCAGVFSPLDPAVLLEVVNGARSSDRDA